MIQECRWRTHIYWTHIRYNINERQTGKKVLTKSRYIRWTHTQNNNSWKTYGINQIQIDWLRLLAVREKCPHMEIFLVRIFPYSKWIRRATPYLFAFSPNAGNTDQKKICIWTLFTQCDIIKVIYICQFEDHVYLI